jgi:hypothetical protein
MSLNENVATQQLFYRRSSAHRSDGSVELWRSITDHK